MSVGPRSSFLCVSLSFAPLFILFGSAINSTKDGWVDRSHLVKKLLTVNCSSEHCLAVPDLFKHPSLDNRVDVDRKDLLQDVIAEHI